MPDSASPDRSFVAPFQRRLIAWALPKLPDALSPLDLSRLAFLGAAMTSAAVILCRWRMDLLFLAPLGLLLNWFGAAFDGPLAAFRNQSSRKLGLAEHLIDLASLFMMIVAYAFSPFLTFEAAAIILTCFLLFSAYTYLRAATGHAEQMALIGVGATEFRLLLASWPFIARAVDPDRAAVVTYATGVLALIAVAALAIKIILDARKIASADR